MKNHNFKPVGYACGTGRYLCENCGAQRLDDDPPHHFPSWRTMSMDCDIAKKRIEELNKIEAAMKLVALAK